jgi:hypothetical protein
MGTGSICPGRTPARGERPAARGRICGTARLVLVASSAITLAACAGSVATSPPAPSPSAVVIATPTPPTAASTPTEETSSVASPSTVADEDLTPAPAASPALAAVPVVRCVVTFGPGWGPEPSLPVTQEAVLPSDIAEGLAFYGFAYPESDPAQVPQPTLVLAPKGWACTGMVGTDGSFNMRVADPADDHAAVVEVGSGGADFTYRLSLACPFFPDAAKQMKADFPNLLESGTVTCSVPTGEQVERIDGTDVGFTDAPGVKGTGDGSGSSYAVTGAVHFEGIDRGATRVSCALADRSAALCGPIVDAFVASPR